MRSKPTGSSVWLLVASIFTFSNAALATNGYFTHGVGSESKGMAGTAEQWFSFSGAVSADVSYQSTLSMSEFDDYSDLFAESGGFDIPASTKITAAVSC